MPQQFDDDFDEDEYGEEAGGSDLVKNLRKQIRERDKALKEANEQLSKLGKQTRERTIADVLQAKGVNPKVAALIPSDVEASPEAVNQWVTDWADVFGFQVEQPSPGAEQAPTEEQAAQERMRAVENNGSTAVGADALAQRIAATGGQAELMTLLRQHGAA